MKHFGAVFKLDLTEETRTQLQEEEAIASSCLILAMSMCVRVFVCASNISVTTRPLFQHRDHTGLDNIQSL